MHQYLERVVDLLDPASNQIYNMTVDEARARLLNGSSQSVRQIEGSFALVAREGKRVRLARSMDRPLRYFLAKRAEGPALIVAPSYTRMVPAHYVIELQLIGCPDPDPVYTRFFDPQRNKLSTDLDEIGRAYIGALADEIAKWLHRIGGVRPSPGAATQERREASKSSNTPNRTTVSAAEDGRTPPPIGVCFSGGIDSGAVFLTTYHIMRKLGISPSRLKAFTLSFGDGPDLQQAREFLERLSLGLFLEPIEADLADLDVAETIRVVEDYKPLDIESASMALTLCRGIRARYPEWRHLIDGDGGDENLKDYPIEENPELTIRSVVSNQMLYQEGWGVGRIKHSLTYSGGLSRSYTRTYAPAKHFGFEGFSPFTRPNVIEVAEGIPFTELTGMDVEKLYTLKGDIVARGVKAITGMDMPVFPKRRFQHGAVKVDQLRQRVPGRELELRRQFLAMYQ